MRRLILPVYIGMVPEKRDRRTRLKERPKLRKAHFRTNPMKSGGRIDQVIDFLARMKALKICFFYPQVIMAGKALPCKGRKRAARLQKL